MLPSYLTLLATALQLEASQIESSTDAKGRHFIKVSRDLIEDPAVLITAHEAVLKTLSWGCFATHLTADGKHQLILMPHTQTP